ncbi:MAG: hypothetical protein ACTSWP_09665 [Candidatus Freyarchaeota archaeon]|nr:hypothetical protein [Candidatus Freyrarchaeum guaymaensis]
MYGSVEDEGAMIPCSPLPLLESCLSKSSGELTFADNEYITPSYLPPDITVDAVEGAGRIRVHRVVIRSQLPLLLCLLRIDFTRASLTILT